jgi:UDP-N-acetylglucosamine:LPS N-acetylglucosamine transferase
MAKKKKDFKDIKIAIVGSSGGHLTHMMLLKKLWENHDRFWVTFDKPDANSQLKDENVYHCYYPTNRNIKNLIKNTFLAWKILRKEKPDLIISSGAAVAMPFFFLGKLFFRKKCVYVEVFDRIDKPTISGKFCYKFSDLFFVQWEEQLKVYPKAKYIGRIF